MLHKLITSDITFECCVSMPQRIGVALADYFSNSLPGSIKSENAPSSGGNLESVLQIPPELLWYF